MGLEESIIDKNKLDLLLKHSTPKEIKKINRRINSLFSGFSRNTMKIIYIMEKLNSLSTKQTEDPFYTIGSRHLKIVNNDNKTEKAIKIINEEGFIGFDTEQKPTFKKGEKQKDISIIQIATKNHCFIFQMKLINNNKPIADVLANPDITKIGFGLNNDHKELKKQLNIEVKSLFDLGPFIKSEFGYKNQAGAKFAVAVFLEMKLRKSKNVVLSNWEKKHLSEKQIQYAAEDATAPYDVYLNILEKYPSFLK